MRVDIINWAKSVLADSTAVILDTETTGLGSADEVVDVAVIDLAGQTLLNSLVRPTVPIHPRAAAVHGLDEDALIDAPGMAYLYPELQRVLAGRRVLVYNAEFDQRIIDQSCAAGGVGYIALPSFEDVMYPYAVFYGTWSRYHGNYRWQSLENACWQMEVTVDAPAHSALGDCLRTLALIKAVAGRRAE
jgi:DNA polymerase III subunit epsilon